MRRGSETTTGRAAARAWRVVCWALAVAATLPAAPAAGSLTPALNAAAPAIANGGSFACAIAFDGTPACWGNNSSGQATPPGDIGAVTQIATGGSHACAIKSDGTPVCWGNNANDRATVPPATGTVTQIDAGIDDTCVIKTDGTGRCWGRSLFGETSVPAALGTITQISAGGAHTCAITTSGAHACWGYGAYVTAPPGVGTVTHIAAGGRNTCAVRTDGSPVCWGDDDIGSNQFPVGIGKVATVEVGGVTACAIKVDGTPVCWGGEDVSYGYNYGQMNVPAGTGTVTEISGGDYFTCALKTDATVACWGRNEANQTVEPPGTFGHTTLDAGFLHTCAVRTGGAACWTRNNSGESTVPAGVGTVTQVSVEGEHSCAVRTSGLPICWGIAVAPPNIAVTRLATGGTHYCAIRTDGLPTCWGDASAGKLDVPAGTGTVTAVSAGTNHTCAIRTGGGPACWGLTSAGQTAVPAAIGTVADISAGGAHTCAIQTGGTPVCWGANSFGQTNVPDALAPVTRIVAGGSFSCALRANGTPACWGSNGSGPAIVPAGTGTVTELTAGESHACATRTDGFVTCWGADSAFQFPTPAVFSTATPPYAGAAPFAFTTVQAGARPGATYALSAGALPGGLLLNTATGRVAGTATVAGTFGVTITASNGIIPSSSRAFSFRVELEAPVTGDTVDTHWHPAPVAVTLGATDGGGAGLDKTFYETGTSPPAPTTTSPVYDPANKPVLGDGQKIRYFSTDKAGNAESQRTSFTAKVDPAVPETTIDTPPAALSSEARPAIAFSTGVPEATFRCAVDATTPEPCSSPFKPGTALGDGAHTFTVTATSRAGIVDATPATAQFTVDTVAPAAPRFSATPPAASTRTTATFAFSGEAGGRFACALDGATAAPCASPHTLTALAFGRHTLRVTQTDGAGHTSAAASHTFEVAVAITAQSLTLTLAGRDSQLLVDKPRVALSVGCSRLACRLLIRSRVSLSGHPSIRLGTLSTDVPAGQPRVRLYLATTKRQRRAIRALARRAGTRKVRLTFDVTATTADGSAATRRVAIELRRLGRG